jgi:hypothetical protein
VNHTIDLHAVLFVARCLRAVFFTAEAARLTAQRRFIASASRFLPAGVIRTFRGAALVELAAGALAAALFAAHRFFSAADTRFRPAGVIPPLRVTRASAGGTGAGVSSILRNAASACSMAVFCLEAWVSEFRR